jgi:hypothetical protein
MVKLKLLRLGVNQLGHLCAVLAHGGGNCFRLGRDICLCTAQCPT